MSEPFADSISFTSESACLLDKKNKKEKKRKRHFLSCFLNSNEQIILLDCPSPSSGWVSVKGLKAVFLKGSRFDCLSFEYQLSCPSRQSMLSYADRRGPVNLVLAYIWWQDSAFKGKCAHEIAVWSGRHRVTGQQCVLLLILPTVLSLPSSYPPSLFFSCHF